MGWGHDGWRFLFASVPFVSLDHRMLGEDYQLHGEIDRDSLSGDGNGSLIKPKSKVSSYQV